MLKTHAPHSILILQIVSFLFIFITGTFLPNDPALFLTQLFAAGFVLWGVYTLVKKSRLSAFIEPSGDTKLLTTGPFEYIRHPVYSGILLFALVSVLSHFTPIRIGALLLLTAVTVYKLHKEEYYLRKRFGKYGQYQQKTKKLIPFLY